MGQNLSHPKNTAKYTGKSSKGKVPTRIDVRRTCSQFRILVIGKANAGKTTLLKKVCDSIDDPEIFSPDGEKIDPKVVEASRQRGEHDITNQLVFKSNPGYIFHDSRGFESGTADEIEQVKLFIAKRAETTDLSKQIHAIWYCLPTDTNRPVTKAEEDFFNTGVRGQVPLIAIFTKIDGLEDKAFTELQNAGYDINTTMKKLGRKTQEMLTTTFREPLKQTQYPPSEYVQLGDMRQAHTKCKELIEKTAGTISDDALRMLFVSVQQNNIRLAVRYAVNDSIDKDGMEGITTYTLGVFGHIWTPAHQYDRDRLNLAVPDDDDDNRALFDAALDDDNFAFFDDAAFADEDQFSRTLRTCESTLNELFPTITLHLVTARVELLSAICICTEQTFSEESTMSPETFCDAFSTALRIYRGSTLESNVNKKIRALPWRNYKDQTSFKNSPLHESMIEIIMSHPLRLK